MPVLHPANANIIARNPSFRPIRTDYVQFKSLNIWSRDSRTLPSFDYYY